LSDAYEVRVNGDASVVALESLCADVELEADTVLQAVVENQAALQLLLAHIRDLGLEIVHIRQVS
jgi:hypothetical protein